MVLTLLFGDEKYPRLLKEISNPPLKLYYRGELTDDSKTHIAIVGTRRATLHGKKIAKKFSHDLSKAGCVIVSGLALGIDAAAHEGALEANGKTIAVLANGLHEIYPRQNEELGKNILERGGAILSEYPEGAPALKNQFLERNRIISGLSVGIIVIEAPESSGALSTASHALEQNREVFIVPGSLNNENYLGSHKLIRAGARMVTSAEDVLEDLNIAPLPVEQKLLLENAHLDERQNKIVNALKIAGEPITVDKMSELMKIDVSAVSRTLTFLLIKGIVKEEAGRYYMN